MRENNLMTLALIGVIIGASGLGFGAYSTMQVQTGAPPSINTGNSNAAGIPKMTVNIIPTIINAKASPFPIKHHLFYIFVKIRIISLLYSKLFKYIIGMSFFMALHFFSFKIASNQQISYKKLNSLLSKVFLELQYPIF